MATHSELKVATERILTTKMADRLLNAAGDELTGLGYAVFLTSMLAQGHNPAVLYFPNEASGRSVQLWQRELVGVDFDGMAVYFENGHPIRAIQLRPDLLAAELLNAVEDFCDELLMRRNELLMRQEAIYGDVHRR